MGRILPDRQKVKQLLSSREGIGGTILVLYGIAKFAFQLIRGGVDIVSELQTVKDLWPSLRDGVIWVYDTTSLNAVAVIAGAGLIWHSLRTPKVPSPPLDMTFKPPLPPPSPPLAYSEIAALKAQSPERIIVNVTPEYLMGIFSEGKTNAQGQREAAPYFGKWVKWSGAVNDINVISADLTMVSFNLTKAVATQLVFMHFCAKWADHLSILNIGEHITVFGQIAKIGRGEVQLYACELVN